MPIPPLLPLEVSRRRILQTGACGLLGFGAQQLLAKPKPTSARSEKSVIYIFLSGGLGQQDTFDPKPEAPAEIRGDFGTIETATPGLQICEHLPLLAARSQRWSLVRSLTHKYNEHSQGHMVMLSGRTDLPTGFDASKPKPTDHPSIAAIVGSLLPDEGSLPPAIVLPERLIHRTGRVIPGQFSGIMGAHRDPYFLSASRFNAQSYGAWPEYGFHHQRGGEDPKMSFETPNLQPPEGVSPTRVSGRLELLNQLQPGTGGVASLQETAFYSRYQDRAVSLMTERKMKDLFDVTHADEQTLDRYGRNSFGWSLLLARRLVSTGVRFVQVNLGNNETWDTHGNAFPHLKNYLLPPFDRCLSALLDDLSETGELDNTLIVVAGEFGRTPKVFGLPQHYKLPGRDHWGAVQTVLLAGGGVRGGSVVGSTDHEGGQPVDAPQRPENLAATIYHALGFANGTNWYDLGSRPHPLYHDTPISGIS
ncbi:MAG: DUF1501 domain-containing protein [Planctomycetaceae bacterium]|nr:DUF1501 domain-containing protein [Planctomycetaceae bacterium]